MSELVSLYTLKQWLSAECIYFWSPMEWYKWLDCWVTASQQQDDRFDTLNNLVSAVSCFCFSVPSHTGLQVTAILQACPYQKHISMFLYPIANLVFVHRTYLQNQHKSTIFTAHWINLLFFFHTETPFRFNIKVVGWKTKVLYFLSKL